MDFPRDMDAERQVLVSLIVSWEDRDMVLGQLDVDDFYLARKGFHGWLYGLISEAVQIKQDPVQHALRHHGQAKELGVRNLAHELAMLMFDLGGNELEFSIWTTRAMIQRVKKVSGMRKRIYSALDELNGIKDEWDKYNLNRGLTPKEK